MGELNNKYPFLDTGKYLKLENIFSTTPPGWGKLIRKMCDSILKIVNKDKLTDFKITGFYYGTGGLIVNCVNGNDDISDILDYYNDKTSKTCVKCGKTADRWYNHIASPLCSDCYKDLDDRYLYFDI